MGCPVATLTSMVVGKTASSFGMFEALYHKVKRIISDTKLHPDWDYTSYFVNGDTL